MDLCDFGFVRFWIQTHSEFDRAKASRQCLLPSPTFGITLIFSGITPVTSRHILPALDQSCIVLFDQAILVDLDLDLAQLVKTRGIFAVSSFDLSSQDCSSARIENRPWQTDRHCSHSPIPSRVSLSALFGSSLPEPPVAGCCPFPYKRCPSQRHPSHLFLLPSPYSYQLST